MHYCLQIRAHKCNDESRFTVLRNAIFGLMLLFLSDLSLTKIGAQLSCNDVCSINLQYNSMSVPEAATFVPLEGFLELGILTGCVGVVATLSCNNGSIYNTELEVTSNSIVLQCTIDKEWIYGSSNKITPLRYLIGCFYDPPCILEGENDFNLVVTQQTNILYHQQNNDTKMTFLLVGAEGATITFECPAEDQRIFVNQSYLTSFTLTCNEGSFKRSKGLPACYTVDIGTIQDPMKQCSSSTGVPFCQHLFEIDETVVVSTKLARLDQSSPLKLTACISQSIEIKCLISSVRLWVQENSTEMWKDLKKYKIEGKCGEIIGMRYKFALWTSLAQYKLLSSNPQMIAKYSCAPPEITSTIIATTELTSTTTEMTSTTTEMASTTTELTSTTTELTSTTAELTSTTTELTSSTTELASTTATTTETLSTTALTSTTSGLSSTTILTEMTTSTSTITQDTSLIMDLTSSTTDLSALSFETTAETISTAWLTSSLPLGHSTSTKSGWYFL